MGYIVESYGEFLNERNNITKFDKSIEKELIKLGFRDKTEWSKTDSRIEFGDFRRKSYGVSEWVHPKLPDYTLKSLPTSWSSGHGGFTIKEGPDPYYIWYGKITSNTYDKRKFDKVIKIATLMSKGKLPKSNPKTIEKWFNT